MIDLSKPIFSGRTEFSLANFCDNLIFFTGGVVFGEESGASSEVFCYDIKANKWTKAPEMQSEKHKHSSCIQGTSLYVYDGIKGEPIERLKEANRCIIDD